MYFVDDTVQSLFVWYDIVLMQTRGAFCFCSEMYFWLHIAALAIIVHFRFIHPIFSKSRERGKVVTTQTPVNVSADGDKKDR